MTLQRILATLTLLATPTLALAHPGHEHSGLLVGLAHPVGGLDHLLAMAAIGLWAAQQKGAARWSVPLAFVLSMLAGGLLGFAGWQLPFMETSIAASVLALGLLVALAIRPALPVAVGLASLFALGHGVAHGLELPALTSPASYALGFVAATIGLHAAGFWMVRAAPRAAAPVVRLAGGLAAGAGAWLLAT